MQNSNKGANGTTGNVPATVKTLKALTEKANAEAAKLNDLINAGDVATVEVMAEVITEYVTKAEAAAAGLTGEPAIKKLLNMLKAHRSTATTAVDKTKIMADMQAAAGKSATLYRPRRTESKATKKGKKFTRLHAVITVLQANPDAPRDVVVIAADKLFIERTGGASNQPEMFRRYRYAAEVFCALNLRTAKV